MSDGIDRRRLFIGCVVSLVATAFGFAVRGAIHRGVATASASIPSTVTSRTPSRRGRGPSSARTTSRATSDPPMAHVHG